MNTNHGKGRQPSHNFARYPSPAFSLHISPARGFSSFKTCAAGKTRRMPKRFVLLERKQAFELRAALKSLRLACSETEVLCHPSGVLAMLSRTDKEKTDATIAAADELARRFEKKLEQMEADELTYNSVRTRAPRTVPPPAHSTCRVRGRLGLAAAQPHLQLPRTCGLMWAGAHVGWCAPLADLCVRTARACCVSGQAARAPHVAALLATQPSRPTPPS